MNFSLGQFAYQAARDLGCLRAGGVLGTDLLSDIKDAANMLLDSWLADELIVPASPAEVFSLTPAQQIYTIGPNETAPNFTSPRPLMVDDANIILNTVSPVLRTPLEIINVDQWANIPVQTIPNALPLRLYYEMSFDINTGAGRMLFWPGPLLAYQFELFTGDQLVLRAFTDTTTAYKYPALYARLIRKQLAVEIAPLMTMYCKAGRAEGLMAPTAAMLALVSKQADDAMARVCLMNTEDPILAGDPAFQGAGSRSGFNYLTGLPGRGR